MGAMVSLKTVCALLVLSTLACHAWPSNAPLNHVISARIGSSTPSFTERGSAAGVANTGHSFAIALADINGDGWVDIFLTNSGSSNKLFINEVGSGHFSDATSSAGLDSGTGASRGAVIADLTGDGNVDIYVGFASGPNKLYVGNGKGNFVDGTASAGVGDTGMAQGVSVGDCDGDGDLDLFVANYQQSNVFYLNAGNGKFTDGTAAAGLTSGSSGFEGTFGDADGDGDLDLYVTFSGKDNILYTNNGQCKFTANSTAGVGGGGHDSRAASWADVDADGDLDIFTVNADPGENQLFINNGNGVFSDVTSAAGIGGDIDGVAQGCNLADVNADGFVDAFVAGIGPLEENELYENNGHGHYSNVARAAGVNDVIFGQGVAFADFDDDGDLDAYVATWGYPPAGWPSQGNKFYNNDRSNIATHTSFLKVRPVGANGNATLLGALVRIFEAGTSTPAGGVVMIDGGGGFGSQNGYDAYFGLAGQPSGFKVDVEIRLPGKPWTTKATNPSFGGVAVNCTFIAHMS